MGRSTRNRGSSLNYRDLERAEGHGTGTPGWLKGKAQAHTSRPQEQQPTHPLVAAKKKASQRAGWPASPVNKAPASPQPRAKKGRQSEPHGKENTAKRGASSSAAAKQQNAADAGAVKQSQRTGKAPKPAAAEEHEDGQQLAEPPASARKRTASRSKEGGHDEVSEDSGRAKRQKTGAAAGAQQQAAPRARPVPGLPGVSQVLPAEAAPAARKPAASRKASGSKQPSGSAGAAAQPAAEDDEQQHEEEARVQQQAQPQQRKAAAVHDAAGPSGAEAGVGEGAGEDAPGPSAPTVPAEQYSKLLAEHRALRARYEELKRSRVQELEAVFEEEQARMEEHTRNAAHLSSLWRLEAEKQAALAQASGTADLQDERDKLQEENLVLRQGVVEAEARMAEAELAAAAAERELAMLRARVVAHAQAQTDPVAVVPAPVCPPPPPRELRAELVPEGLEGEIVVPDNSDAARGALHAGCKAVAVPVTTPAPAKHAAATAAGAPAPGTAAPPTGGAAAAAAAAAGAVVPGPLCDEALPEARLELAHGGAAAAAAAAAAQPCAPAAAPVAGQSGSELQQRVLQFPSTSAPTPTGGAPPADDALRAGCAPHGGGAPSVDMSLSGTAALAAACLGGAPQTPGRALPLMIATGLEGVSARDGACVYSHRASGFAFRLGFVDEDGEEEDGADAGPVLEYRPLALGAAARVLPPYLRETIYFGQGERFRFLERVSAALEAIQ